MTSMPFWNLTPWTTFGNWFSPFNRRQCFCGGVDEFEHHELGGLGRQGSLGPHGSMTHRRKYALDRVRRAQMVPVLGREVEEGEQSFPVLRQAGDRLVVLGAVLVGEHIHGRLGCRAGRRT